MKFLTSVDPVWGVEALSGRPRFLSGEASIEDDMLFEMPS